MSLGYYRDRIIPTHLTRICKPSCIKKMSENHITSAPIKDPVELKRLDGNGMNNLSFFTNAMHHMLHNCSNLLCIATDPFGVITLFNAGAELTLGFTADEVVNKLSLTDICDPIDLMKRNDEMNAEFETCIAPGFDTIVYIASEGTEDLCALTYISKTDKPVHVEVSVNTTIDDSGKLIGFMVIGTEKHSSHDDENPGKLVMSKQHMHRTSQRVFSSQTRLMKSGVL
jgi:hypothetical protein